MQTVYLNQDNTSFKQIKLSAAELEAGKDKFKEIIEFDSIDESSVISMVEKNLGIAVLPSLLVKHKSSGVHILKLKPEISRTIGFAYKTEALQNDCTAKFIKFIKKEFNL